VCNDKREKSAATLYEEMELLPNASEHLARIMRSSLMIAIKRYLSEMGEGGKTFTKDFDFKNKQAKFL
jgi:hypothetical protein